MLIYFSSSVYYKPCLNDHLEWLLVRGQIIPWPTRAHRNIWSELGFLDVSWGDKNGGIDLSLSPFLSMCKKHLAFLNLRKRGRRRFGEVSSHTSLISEIWGFYPCFTPCYPPLFNLSSPMLSVQTNRKKGTI